MVATGLLALSFAVPTGLAAQAEELFGACASEVASNCSDVEPGHGRLYACLYSHDDKLSDGCLAATADVHDALDFFFEGVRFAKQECMSDIETFCSDVSMGGGRILSCLRGHEDRLEASCGNALHRFAVLDTPEDPGSE
jgi:hypothetical protein